MTNTEYLQQIAEKLGIDVTQLPDNLITTHLEAILAALNAGGGSGGGSGAKLYRHTICLYNDDGGDEVYVVILNTDPTPCESVGEFNEEYMYFEDYADISSLISKLGDEPVPAFGQVASEGVVQCVRNDSGTISVGHTDEEGWLVYTSYGVHEMTDTVTEIGSVSVSSGSSQKLYLHSIHIEDEYGSSCNIRFNVYSSNPKLFDDFSTSWDDEGILEEDCPLELLDTLPQNVEIVGFDGGDCVTIRISNRSITLDNGERLWDLDDDFYMVSRFTDTVVEIM